MTTGEKDKIVKIKIEINGGNLKFEAKGEQAKVIDQAIKALKNYKEQLGVY